MPESGPRGTHHLRDAAAYVARETGPLMVMLAVVVAFVAGLAFTVAPTEDPDAGAGTTPSLAGAYDGFRFETVGVGVRRLLDDGAGRRPGDRFFLISPDPEVIAFESDGSVLVCCDDADLIIGDTTHSKLHRLGDPEPVIRWEDEGRRLEDSAGMIVTPDGGVWLSGPQLASLGPRGWQKHGRMEATAALTAGRDGAVWVGVLHRGRLAVARVHEGKITLFTVGQGLPTRVRGWDPVTTGIATTPDGDVWLGVSADKPGREGGLLRYDGKRWRVVHPLGANVAARVEGLSAAPDGTLWVYLSRDVRAGGSGVSRTTRSYLARFDGQVWTVRGERSGVPHHGWPHRFEGVRVLMAAGPSGTVWLAPVPRDGCRQLVAWHEDGLSSPLAETACVEELKVAPDGSAWVMVSWDESRGAERWYTELYVVDI